MNKQKKIYAIGIITSLSLLTTACNDSWLEPKPL